MCKYRSGEAVRRGDRIELLTLPGDDSHNKIRERYGIPEATGSLGDSYHTPVEFVPCGDFANLADYELIYEADRPEWLTDSMQDTLVRRFRAVVAPDIADRRIVRDGSIFLDSITDMKNTRIESGCHIWLTKLLSMEYSRIKAGGYAWLSKLASMEHSRIESGCHIWLTKLTSMEYSWIKAGDYVNLRNLTSMEHSRIKAGGYAFLSKLASIPANADIEVGGKIFFRDEYRTLAECRTLSSQQANNQ